MLKEIDCDESHSHKEKIIFITPLMAYKLTQQLQRTPPDRGFPPVLHSCTPSPPYSITYIIILKEKKSKQNS
jgi:hypothetical protein